MPSGLGCTSSSQDRNSSTNTTRGATLPGPLAIAPSIHSRRSCVNNVHNLSCHHRPLKTSVTGKSCAPSRNFTHSVSLHPSFDSRNETLTTTNTTLRFGYSRRVSNCIPAAKLEVGFMIATHLILSRAPQAANRRAEDRGPHIQGELGPRWRRSASGLKIALLLFSCRCFEGSKSTNPWSVRQSSLICLFSCRSLFGSFLKEPS